MSCRPLVMAVKLLGRFVPVGTAVGRVFCWVARARMFLMSGRRSDLGRNAALDLSPEDLVPGDVLLARTTPRPLTRYDGATLEDLATPDTPRLGPLQRAGQALDPDAAVATQRLGQFQLGGGVGEPQVRVEPTARQVHAHLDVHVGCQHQAHLPVTSLSLSSSALDGVQ